MIAAIRHRGPDDDGVVGERRRRARQRAARDHRPVSDAGHQPMVDEDGRPRPHLQRRALQLPRARRGLERAGHRSARAATPRSCCARTRSGASSCVQRFDGMFAFAIWDAASGELFSRATASGSSRSTTPSRDRPPPVRLGDQGAARGRPSRGASRRRRSSSTSRSRTSSPTSRSSTACSCCRRPGILADRRRVGRRRSSATGTSSSSPTSPSSEAEWVERDSSAPSRRP